jgi:hypothetical protein
MNRVVLLEHLRVDDEGNDHVKTIGIYRTIAAAKAAVGRLKDKPGFRNNPSIVDLEVNYGESGFYISEYPLDKDFWTEGFGWEEENDNAQQAGAADATSRRD